MKETSDGTICVNSCTFIKSLYGGIYSRDRLTLSKGTTATGPVHISRVCVCVVAGKTRDRKASAPETHSRARPLHEYSIRAIPVHQTVHGSFNSAHICVEYLEGGVITEDKVESVAPRCIHHYLSPNLTGPPLRLT